MDRRHNTHPDESPMATLQQLPALVVLERIPVPVLAIADDGTILFANTGFAEMLGYTKPEVLELEFAQIFSAAQARQPDRESALQVMRSLANLVVALAHRDGSTVQALMSRSALMRADDRVALATFQDLTEQLWLAGH